MARRNRHKSYQEKFGLRIEDGDFAQIPNILLQRPSELGLKPGDLALYLYLESYPYDYFHPVSSISKDLGMHPNTIRIRIRRLEKLRYIRRVYARGSGNTYDLTGLRMQVRNMSNFGERHIRNLDAPRSKINEYDKQILYTNKDNTNKEKYSERARIKPRPFRRKKDV